MDTRQLMMGLVLSTCIGYVAYLRGSLTKSGWLGAVITGTGTFGFGGWGWGITLIVFFISSSLLSRFHAADKQRVTAETFEKGSQRDIWQALANGGAGALLAIGWAILDQPPLMLAAFAGVMATVTADTWATELGVLSRTPPRLITTLRPVPPGTSGGITRVGMLATCGGAALIGLTLALAEWWATSQFGWWVFIAALLGGTVGCLADSLLGATVQAMYETPQGVETERMHTGAGRPHRRIRGLPAMNNDAVNIISSLVGGAFAALIGYVLLR